MLRKKEGDKRAKDAAYLVTLSTVLSVVLLEGYAE
jgi:hypothetical protein